MSFNALPSLVGSSKRDTDDKDAPLNLAVETRAQLRVGAESTKELPHGSVEGVVIW